MAGIEIKRKNGESVEGMLRRFKRRLQKSRLLLRVKESEYRQKPKTKRQQRVSTLERQRRGKKIAYLKKIGRIKDDEKMF